MDAQIKPNEEECALGMEHEDCDAFTIHGSAYDETTVIPAKQRLPTKNKGDILLVWFFAKLLPITLKSNGQ